MSANLAKIISATELRPLVRLAGPVVLAEIGWMAMGLVDTLMVGPLGPAAIAATGMGSSVFTAIAIFGMGLMLGLDALVAGAAGAGRNDECVQWLRQGLVLAVAIAPLVILATWAMFVTIGAWGLNLSIRVLAEPYLQVVAWSAPPLLVYAALRRYLQGIHEARPVMYALMSANLVNAAANALLIYGRMGAPALGVTGAAWATCIARVYLAAFLWVSVRRAHRRASIHPRGNPWTIEWRRLRTLVALGAPAASQITLEVGVFTLATALAAKLDAVSSASHQIALNIASVIFMVPLGVASAGAVRVAHAIGALDLGRARSAGWTALALGAAMMTILGLGLFLFPTTLLGIFTTDAAVVATGTRLLIIAAAFQLFDGTQAVATGVLRGVGDTRTPMTVNVIGHWLLGLPVGYALCFHIGLGVSGLWIGLSIGLVFCAVALLLTWTLRTRRGTTVINPHRPTPPELL